jgi:hypothetical protein
MYFLCCRRKHLNVGMVATSIGLTSSCLEADKVETVISGMEEDKLKHP